MSEEIMMREYEEELEQEQGFRVTDDMGAKWCLEQMRKADQEMQEAIEWYTSLMKKAAEKCDAVHARMTAYLRDYAEMVPMKETKTQMSYPIPGGKMVLKKAHTALKHDDAVLLRTLKEQGRDDMIKRQVVEKVDWMSLKKEIQDTGEMLDGVTVEEVPEEFVVQMDKE